MKFKIGDKVRVRLGLRGDNYYDGLRFDERMEAYCGCVYTIIGVDKEDCRYWIDTSGWVFNEAMIECAVKYNNNNNIFKQ